MDRQKFYDRTHLTYEEKMDIAAKSDNRCAHCGETRFINYGATIDHFIPISKGGMDRYLNMVMLCEKCNKEKADKIYDITYLKYLKNEYVDDLEKYVDNYIHTFDYIGRKKMFAYDEYEFLLSNPQYQMMLDTKRGKYLKNKNMQVGSKYKVKRAGNAEFEKVCKYFEKYLKKYNAFADYDTVVLNISFWMKFGSIYYVEKNNEIYMLFIYTVKHLPVPYKNHKDINYTLNVYIFSYYSSTNAYSLAYGLARKLVYCIIDENGIGFIPVDINIYKEDPLSGILVRMLNDCGASQSDIANELTGGTNGFYQISFNMTTFEPGHEYTDQDGEGVIKFFKQFDDINKRLIKFFRANRSSWIGWMLYDILSCYDILENDILNLEGASDKEIEENESLIDINEKMCEYYDKRIMERSLID